MFIPLHDHNERKYVRIQYVTLAIIAANVVIWLIMNTSGATSQSEMREAYLAYGFIPALINDHAVLPAELARMPAWLSYVTYAFFHADFMHIAGNMLFLWVFGDNVEDAMGHLRFLVFYLVCAAAGAFAYALMSPETASPLIGASGATSGVVGAYLILHPRVKIWVLLLARIPLRISAMWALTGWIGYQIFSFLTDTTSQVAWVAHVGGIAAGILLIGLFKRRDVRLFDQAITPFTAPGPATTDDAGKPWGRSE